MRDAKSRTGAPAGCIHSDQSSFPYADASFLDPQERTLSNEAQERLKVLQSLDSLGVGFNPAIRDLEIRGAGNLLGKEQSDNVLSVGFDMYCLECF